MHTIDILSAHTLAVCIACGTLAWDPRHPHPDHLPEYGPYHPTPALYEPGDYHGGTAIASNFSYGTRPLSYPDDL